MREHGARRRKQQGDRRDGPDDPFAPHWPELPKVARA
jgi:hypothetical protein